MHIDPRLQRAPIPLYLVCVFDSNAAQFGATTNATQYTDAPFGTRSSATALGALLQIFFAGVHKPPPMKAEM